MSVELGLGLIGIGRPWPHEDREVPAEAAVWQLLRTAIDLGIRVFDTAAAYGVSEERLGSFLGTLAKAERDRLVVSTKCGETWDPEQGSQVGQSPAALRASVARSVDRLGRIDVLQLHKASSAVLSDDTVIGCLVDLGKEYSIGKLGVSVSDTTSFEQAVKTGVFEVVQCPYNARYRLFEDSLSALPDSVAAFVNRPYASGELSDETHRLDSLRTVRARLRQGVVLSGTTRPAHLADNARLFDLAQGDVDVD